MFSVSAQASTVRAYGPGGPAPAMKEAAAAFKARTGVNVVVTAGPTPQWIDAARGNADVMFSGAENMMTDFVKAMNGAIDEKTIDPLYLRASNILVRPGNPHHRSEEHTSELQSLMRISYAVFCLKKKKTNIMIYKKS